MESVTVNIAGYTQQLYRDSVGVLRCQPCQDSHSYDKRCHGGACECVCRKAERIPRTTRDKHHPQQEDMSQFGTIDIR